MRATVKPTAVACSLDRPDRRQLPAAKDLSRDEHRKPGGVHRQRDAALLDLIQGQPR